VTRPDDAAAVRAHLCRVLPANDDIYVYSAPRPAGPPDAAELTVTWFAGKSPSARGQYLPALISWLGYCRRPLSAGPHEVEAWLNRMTVPATPPELLRQPAPLSVLARCLRAVSAWYNFLVTHQGCAYNPAAAVIAPPQTHVPRRRPTDLTPYTSAVLVELAHAYTESRPASEESWRNAALLSLLFYTGISVDTVIALELNHLIGLPDQTSRLTLWAGPDHPGGAMVHLPACVERPLRTYLTLRAERSQLALQHLHGPLLAGIPRWTQCSQTCAPLLASHVSALITRLADRAGTGRMPTFTPCPAVARPPAPPSLPPIMHHEPGQGTAGVRPAAESDFLDCGPGWRSPFRPEA
jgi:site-specific recombinase XerD